MPKSTFNTCKFNVLTSYINYVRIIQQINFLNNIMIYEYTRKILKEIFEGFNLAFSKNL